MAQIINKCEERLIKEGSHTTPFSVDEIRGGALKGILIPSDYTAPMEVRVNVYIGSIHISL